MAALQYSFDWCKSLQQNMEQFHLHITKLTSYSLTCDTNEQVLVILLLRVVLCVRRSSATSHPFLLKTFV